MPFGLGEKCGVFGIYNHSESARIAYLGLHALQHRGQESVGLTVSNGKSLYTHKQMGHVGDIDETTLDKLEGNQAIGHVRYSTGGASLLRNAQPFVIDYWRGTIAVAHNGNLVNAKPLRKKLEENGSIFQSSMDTEVIFHLMAASKSQCVTERLSEALQQVKGAYSLVFLTNDNLIGVRDPNGFRPLILGRLKKSHVLASETCALNLIDAEYIREIKPGEMVIIDKDGVKSIQAIKPNKQSYCIFELIYFSRPDSLVNGKDVYALRKKFGHQLAMEHPVDGDVVIPVPDSGVAAAIGYAEESNIPFEMGLIRSHYVGRTFIEPSQNIRHFGVKLKLSPVQSVLKNKKVVVVDDSIVRGTTSRKIVKMLKDAGAKEVHVRISSPPIKCSCFYGIDTPTKSELIASSHSVEEINRFITATSVGYLSVEGMHEAVKNGANFCNACFTGNYPVENENTSV